MSSDSQLKGKRITLKRSRPNPLFEEWLEELYEEAKTKKSKLESMLKEALESLSKYPLPLKTGMECAVLKGFDKKLCKFMDKRIEVYNYNRQHSQPSTSSAYNKCNSQENPHPSTSTSTVNNNNNSQQNSHPVTSTSSACINYNSQQNSHPSTSTACNNYNGLQNPHASASTSSSSNYNSKQNSGSSSSPEVSPLQSQALAARSNKIISRTKKHFNNNSTSSDDVEIVDQLNLSANSETSSKKVSPKISKNQKEYKPKFRTGSYALLVALLEQQREDPSKPSLQRDELIEKAQPHSEESFTKPKPNSFYTAWSSMRRLVTKKLVKQVRSNKVDYSLTVAGISLAIELLEDAKNRPTVNDIIFNGTTSSSGSIEIRNGTAESTKIANSNGCSIQNSQVSFSQRTVSDTSFIELPAGTFDVILLIDKQETGGVKNKKDPTVAQFNKYPDLKHEYRSLKVGDYTWIARHKVNTDQELVIPYVVERKRMDDLGHSIKDGRFHEQKFRLRKCGLANVLYLVENFGCNKHVGLPMQSLMQALANTRVQDGFKVYNTNCLTNTARFLAMMTKRLSIEYKDKHLIGASTQPQGEEMMTFSYFNKSSTKNKALTVTETFIKLLLQLKGVSVEKALAITKVYSTPKSLMNAYENCTQKDGESLLANLKYGNLNRNVGPMVSKAVYKFFVWRE